jgi:hypothetical protein
MFALDGCASDVPPVASTVFRTGSVRFGTVTVTTRGPGFAFDATVTTAVKEVPSLLTLIPAEVSVVSATGPVAPGARNAMLAALCSFSPVIVSVKVPSVFARLVGETDSTTGAVLTALVTVTLTPAEANPLADNVNVASPALFALTRNVVELWPAGTVIAAGAVVICGFDVATPTVVSTVTAVPIDTVTGELVAPSESSCVVGVAVRAAVFASAVIPNTSRVVRI